MNQLCFFQLEFSEFSDFPESLGATSFPVTLCSWSLCDSDSEISHDSCFSLLLQVSPLLQTSNRQGMHLSASLENSMLRRHVSPVLQTSTRQGMHLSVSLENSVLRREFRISSHPPFRFLHIYEYHQAFRRNRMDHGWETFHHCGLWFRLNSVFFLFLHPLRHRCLGIYIKLKFCAQQRELLDGVTVWAHVLYSLCSCACSVVLGGILKGGGDIRVPTLCHEKNFTFLGHARWAIYQQHQLIVCTAIHACNRSPRWRSFHFYMHQALSIQCFRTPFSVQHFHLEIGNAVRAGSPCARRYNSGCNCGHQWRNRPFHTNTHTQGFMMGNTSTASQILEPTNVALCHVRSVRRSILELSCPWSSQCTHRTTLWHPSDRSFLTLHPQKLVKATELYGSSCRTTFNFVWTAWYTQQREISPNHSRPHTSTRWYRPHLGTSLSLKPSNHFRTETTSFSTTITWLIVDSTQSSACSMSPWTSLPSKSRFGSSDDFFCVTTSLPISVAFSLFTYSCNPPVSCLVTRHLFGLCTKPICSCWTWTLVVADVRLHSSLDTGFSLSVCFSLESTRSRSYFTCLASHSCTSLCASRLRHPKDLSPPLHAPPQLFADWVVLRTLIVTWKSRHTRAVLASCRFLCNLKHLTPARTPSHPSALDPVDSRQDHHSLAHQPIRPEVPPSSLLRHTRILGRDFLIKNANVNAKILIADIDSVCNVRTLLVDWDQHFSIPCCHVCSFHRWTRYRDFVYNCFRFSKPLNELTQLAEHSLATVKEHP